MVVVSVFTLAYNFRISAINVLKTSKKCWLYAMHGRYFPFTTLNYKLSKGL